MKNKKPDYTKLEPEFIQKLDSLKGNTVPEQVQDLKDATLRGFRAIAQEMKFSEAAQGDLLDKMGELLTQSQKTLTELLNKPEAQMPDNKPLIDAIQAGFDGMRKDLGKIEVNPQVNVDVPEITIPEIKVPETPAPNVGVTVDNREVAKVLKTLPSIFETAINSIEQPDYSDLQKTIIESNDILKDVRKNTAFKTEFPNTISTSYVKPSSSSVSNITMTGSSVEVLAENASRKGAYIYNDTGSTVYIKFGSGASSTSFTVLLINQAFYELPQPIYTGVLTASGPSGDLRVTEVL